MIFFHGGRSNAAASCGTVVDAAIRSGVDNEADEEDAARRPRLRKETTDALKG